MKTNKFAVLEPTTQNYVKSHSRSHNLTTIFSTFFFTSLFIKSETHACSPLFPFRFLHVASWACLDYELQSLELALECSLRDFTTEMRLKPSWKSIVSFIQFFLFSCIQHHAQSTTDVPSQAAVRAELDNWEISQTFADAWWSMVTVRNEASDGLGSVRDQH